MSDDEESIQQILSSLLKNMLDGTEKTGTNSSQVPYDILEKEDEIVIYAEFPGINKDNINIMICNNRITIKGKKYPEYNMEDYNQKYIGVNYSDKVLKLNLPIAITDKDSLSTMLKDGVLCIRIDRTRETDKTFSITPD